MARDLGYVGGTTHDGETASSWRRGSACARPATSRTATGGPTRPTSCAKCAPRFDERFVFTWTRREISSPAGGLAGDDAAPGAGTP